MSACAASISNGETFGVRAQAIVDLDKRVALASGQERDRLVEDMYVRLAALRAGTTKFTSDEIDRLELALASTWEPEPRVRYSSPPEGDRPRRCATVDPGSPTVLRVPRYKRLLPEILTEERLRIEVAWHMILDEDGRGGLSETTLEAQLDTLNAAFRETNILFTLARVDSVRNGEWFRNAMFKETDSVAAWAMVDALKDDPQHRLNVYSVGVGTLGQAGYPWLVAGRPNDAVIINYGTLPSKPDGHATRGKTLVHEVGHYLGLYHTFELSDSFRCSKTPAICFDCDDKRYNGCLGLGDTVDDTPAQRFCHDRGCGLCKAELGCECPDGGRCDSCPDVAGLDPVDNYMGYNPDSCMRRFTQGQRTRMLQSILEHREGLLPPRVASLVR